MKLRPIGLAAAFCREILATGAVLVANRREYFTLQHFDENTACRFAMEDAAAERTVQLLLAQTLTTRTYY
jgi:hypothetical protein